MMLRSGSRVHAGQMQNEAPLGGGDMELDSPIYNQSPIRFGNDYNADQENIVMSPSHESEVDELRRKYTQLLQEFRVLRDTHRPPQYESRSEGHFDPRQHLVRDSMSAPGFRNAQLHAPHYAYGMYDMPQSQHAQEYSNNPRSTHDRHDGPDYNMAQSSYQHLRGSTNGVMSDRTPAQFLGQEDNITSINRPGFCYDQIPIPVHQQVRSNTHGRSDQDPSRWDTQRNPRMYHRHQDLQLKLPIFNGKGNWQGFWVQFELISQHYGWNEDEQRNHLIMTFRDEALEYVSQLTADTRNSLYLLMAAIKRRFDDPVLPETHRARLQSASKESKESVHEYAARINSMTSKAYPGFEGTEMFQKIAIEHMLQGLNDPGVAYDVQTKRPKSMEEAVDMITWHECCRVNSSRRSNIRQLGTEMPYSPVISNTQYANEDFIRRITDVRLAKFEEQLMQSMREVISQVTSAQQDCDGAPNPGQQLYPEDTTWESSSTQRSSHSSRKSKECFICHGLGHLSYDCPSKQPKMRNDGMTKSQTVVGKIARVCLNAEDGTPTRVEPHNHKSNGEDNYTAVDDGNSQLMRQTDVKTIDEKSKFDNYTDYKVRTVQLAVNKAVIDTRREQHTEANKTIHMINSVSRLINKRENFQSDTEPRGDKLSVESITEQSDIKVRPNSDQDTVTTSSKMPIEVIKQDTIKQTDQDKAGGVATDHRDIGIAGDHTLSTLTGLLRRKTTSIKKYPWIYCTVGFIMCMVFILFMSFMSHPYVASQSTSAYSDVTNSMLDILRHNFVANDSNSQRSIVKHIVPDDCQLILLSRLCQYVKWYMEHDMYIRT